MSEAPTAALAALPMYDFPHLREAHVVLWGVIVARLAALGVPAPAKLSWDLPPEAGWANPGLLVGQTCGYPLVKRLSTKVQVLATPRYAAPGCDGAFHRSAIVVAADRPWRALGDLYGRRCAVNALDSNSGMNLLRAEVAEIAGGRPFFSEVVLTGSHRESLASVADGRADVAAIDAVTFELLRGYGGAGDAALRVLGWTRSSPALPWVTGRTTDAPTASALRRVLRDLPSDPVAEPALRTLLIKGFDALPADAYARVEAIEHAAIAKAYADLM